MDFFAAQEHARRQTKWLIFYYVLALLFMITGIYFVLIIFASFIGETTDTFNASQLWSPYLFLAVVAANVLVVGISSLIKTRELSAGGEHIAAMLGGVRVASSTTDLHERRLLNVVEEMALAAGVSVPPVYVMYGEQSINAFAAGYSPADAVVSVNRGTITQLNRDELQGVIAHEFSHILNGDMRINIRLIGLLYGIQILTMIGYFLMRASAGNRNSRSKDDKGNAIVFVGLGIIIFGSVGYFFARLIKASISRQREFLADASAVQFTRYPDGIGGALKMIGATSGSTIKSKEAESLSHMFFASCFQSQMISWLATHPPLPQRIVKLDPRFDGDFKGYLHIRERMAKRRAEQEAKEAESKGGIGAFTDKLLDKFVFPAKIAERFSIDPMILMAAIGEPTRDDVEYSQKLITQIPPQLVDAAHDPFSARCIAFATLLHDEDDPLSQGQFDLIEKGAGLPTVELTRKLWSQVQSLDLALRLPLMEMLQGALSQLSLPQYKQFREIVIGLVKIDGEVSLYEFVVRHHLLMHLDRRLLKTPPIKIRFTSINQLRTETELLLSAFAHVGETDDATTQAAYQVAMQTLGFSSDADTDVPLPKDWKIAQLDQSLKRMTLSSPMVKKGFLQAAAVMIAYDHEITVAEAELFRAVAESLDCPVPAFVAGKTGAVNLVETESPTTSPSD